MNARRSGRGVVVWRPHLGEERLRLVLVLALVEPFQTSIALDVRRRVKSGARSRVHIVS
jgi:hypothetical protein